MKLSEKFTDVNVKSDVPVCIYSKKQCFPDLLFSNSNTCKQCPMCDVNYIKILDAELDSYEQRTDETNYNRIKNKANKDGGKYISFGNKLSDNGFLIGATSTLEDFYWLYMDLERNIHFSSCVGGYTVIDEIPVEFNILDYMRTHDKDFIKKTIDDFIKNMKYDRMISDIHY